MIETSDEVLREHVASTYRALADWLEGAPDTVWDEPSLCTDWRVRELVAHVTMPARYTTDQFMAMLADAKYDFTKLSDRLAHEDGKLAGSVLVGNLRDGVLHQWTPPGGGWHGALNHAAIHALDVTAALEAPRCTGDAALRVVLDDLTSGGVHAHFGVELPERTLRATDLDWSFGFGPLLSGKAEDIALHLCGRRGRLELE